MDMVKKQRVLAGLIGGLLVALVVVIATGMSVKVIGVGDKAPSFSIRTDSGVPISESSFGGRLLVLNFWATWCPPCIEEMPSLDRLQQALKDSGVVVVGLSVDTNETAYRQFLSRANVSFLTARDPEAVVGDRFGTYRYPETYVINSKGVVVQKIIGPAVWDDEKMINHIKSLL